jgi:hypothetical protein
MTSTSPPPGAKTAPRAVRAAARETLPLREPGARGPSFPVPRWKPGASGWAEPGPETMRRVAAALKRL